MKKVLALILAAMMALGAITLAVAEEEQVVSVFYGGGTPQFMDPALNSASAGSNIIRMGFAGLYRHAKENEAEILQPDLAEGYTLSEDGLVYTFTLKEGLKWSDGTDLVASQVASSWNRAGSADLGADYGFLYDYIARNADGTLNVVADDAARTLVVTLAAPTAYFIDLIAFVPFYPVKVELTDNEGIWATKPETAIGAGPFRMTKYAVDDVIAYEKNEFYWDAANVKLSGINCLLSEDNVAMLTAYENDSAVYINSSIDPIEYERLKATYPGELKFDVLLGTYYILFNVHKDLSPAGKQLTVQEQSKARFALGQMVNREDLVNYVTMGGQVPANGFYPPTLSDAKNPGVRGAEGYGTWYTGTATPSALNENYTEDMATALQTLIDLGYAYTGTIEGGDVKFTDFPSIEFSFNNSGANAAIIQYVQEIWNSVGITGVVNTEAWATLQEKLKKGDAEAARMGWVADFNDCVNFLEIFISASGNNYPRLGKDLGDYTRNSEVTKDAGMGAYWGPNGDQTWADAFDKLVDAIKVETDPAARAAKCAEAEKILMDTGAVAPLYFYTLPNLLKPYIKNVTSFSGGDVTWTYAYVEK